MAFEIRQVFQYIKSIFLLIFINVLSFIFGLKEIWDQKMNCWERTNFFFQYLRIKPHVTKNSAKIRPGRTMFFSNHRSWADFFVDGSLCGGASYIARMMVSVGVPGMAFTAWISDYIWLFHRKKHISRDWLTDHMRTNWELRPEDGLIVYPEGHRYSGEGTLPIHTGVMECAYNLHVPCQCVLSLNKESILNEKKLSFDFDVPIYTCVSEVMNPDQFTTKEEWFIEVKRVWEKTYKELAECKEFIACSTPLPGITPEMTHSYRPNNRKVIKFFLVVFAILVALLAIRIAI